VRERERERWNGRSTIGNRNANYFCYYYWYGKKIRKKAVTKYFVKNFQ
jgi:hypothetical protein